MFKLISLILAIMLACMLMAGVTLASPLNDYSKGKTAIDIHWLPNLSMKDSYEGTTDTDSDREDGKRSNLDWGITTGLGGKWAVQYRQFNPETKDIGDWGFGMRTRELNVLYQIDEGLSVFAGWHQAKFTYWCPVSVTADNKNKLQAGFIASTPIAEKTRLYGIAGFGKDLANYEAGLSYEFSPSLDFDLFYRYKKVKNLEDTIGNFAYRDDVTAKGLGFGFSYKF